jgi:hypothetical protein
MLPLRPDHESPGGDETLIVLRDLYPSRDALDATIVSGSTNGFDEQFTQLDEMLAAA